MDCKRRKKRDDFRRIAEDERKKRRTKVYSKGEFLFEKSGTNLSPARRILIRKEKENFAEEVRKCSRKTFSLIAADSFLFFPFFRLLRFSKSFMTSFPPSLSFVWQRSSNSFPISFSLNFFSFVICSSLCIPIFVSQAITVTTFFSFLIHSFVYENIYRVFMKKIEYQLTVGITNAHFLFCRLFLPLSPCDCGHFSLKMFFKPF